MTKLCPRCREIKEVTLFGKDKRRSDGNGFYCKSCRKVQRDYDKDKIKVYNKHYRDGSEEYKLYKRNYDLIRLYGLPLSDYNKKLEAQGGRCAICGIEADSLDRVLFVDHDHTTDIVRDLLCEKCNTAIGLLSDNERLCVIAARYLKRHRLKGLNSVQGE
jgi:hypothetical protein